MNNAELIKALRYCSDNEKEEGCDECPYLHNGMCRTMLSDAACALEADDKRIADLETALSACRARKEQLSKEGEWISNYDGFDYDVRCSVCGEEALIKEGGSHDHAYSRYCPNCGARCRQ